MTPAPAQIIIPAQNEGGNIADCLTSLLAQDHQGPVTVYVVATGCTDDTVIANAVCIAPPAARFNLNPAVGCAVPHLVTFTDQSILPHTWLWDFGDGNTSTIQNPTHNYITPGNYIVTLRGDDGAVSTHKVLLSK